MSNPDPKYDYTDYTHKESNPIKFVFTDKTQTTYEVELPPSVEIEDLIDTIWITKEKSIDGLCNDKGIKRTAKVWVDF